MGRVTRSRRTTLIVPPFEILLPTGRLGIFDHRESIEQLPDFLMTGYGVGPSSQHCLSLQRICLPDTELGNIDASGILAIAAR